jgi:hypothetical protein
MIDLIPARPEMARTFDLQPEQVALGQVADEQTLAAAIQNGIAMAAVQDGRVLAIGGIVEIWKDRGSAWGLLSPNLAHAMPIIHRIVWRVIDTSPLARIEAQVAVGHEAGQRWVRMLGFQHEGVMRAFWNGRDYDLFARVK